MILNYDSFLENLILSQINEAILYYSPDFKKVLNNMKDSEIASDLLNTEATDVKPDTTFIDLDKDGYLSFISSPNAIKLIDITWTGVSSLLKDKPNKRLAELIWMADKNGENIHSGVSTKSRNLIKIGKLVNKIFPDKYKDKDIEDFVNKFKATIENAKEKIIIVEGEDIDYWYDSKNYYEVSGTLGNSCMRSKSGSGYFDIYTKNPEVCRMLILVENGKLKGRALIWKVESMEFTYFLDRQYTINESDVIKFREYATSNGWAYKTYNNHSELGSVTYKGKSSIVSMRVQLKIKSYSKYPYVDTFRRYDVANGVLHNDSEQDSDYAGQYILEDTDGGYEEIRSGKWSEYYGVYINDDDAVWSESLDSYIYSSRSVKIERGSRYNRGWWPDSRADIYYDSYYDDFIHKDDSIYSSYYDHNILESESVVVIESIHTNLTYSDTYIYNDDDFYISMNNFSDLLWFQKLSENNDLLSIDGILRDCLSKKSDNRWCPDSIILNVFEVTSGDYNIEYLSEIDAYLLEVEINDKNPKIVDMVSYDTGLYKTKNIYQALKSKASAIINKNQLSMFDNEDSDPKIKSQIKSRVDNINKRLESLKQKTYILI